MPRKVVTVPKCAVIGCDEEGVRSIPKKKLADIFGKGNVTVSGQRAKVCKEHYKEFKKETKDDRKMERLGW